MNFRRTKMPTYSIKFNQDKESKSIVKAIIERIQKQESYEDLNNNLISYIFNNKSNEKIDQSPLRSQYHGLSGSLYIGIEEDDNGKIINASSMFGAATDSIIHNINEQQSEKSTRVYIRDNYIAILKPSVLFKKDDGENLTTMIDNSLSNSNCYIQDCKVPDEGRQIINNNPKSNIIIADIVTDENDNLIRLESTFGNVDEQDLSEESKKILEDYINKTKSNELNIDDFEVIEKEEEPSNNNNNNQEEEELFDISYDVTELELPYKDTSYKIILDSEECSFHVLNKYNPFKYAPIDRESVPPEVQRLADNFLMQVNPDMNYKSKINNISDALKNDDLWKKNGKELSSVPTKLLEIINSDNYNSQQDKYNAIKTEAQHQQGKKRSLATRWFKPKERPAQVTSIIETIVKGEDVNIEKLTDLATRSNNNNENNTLNFKKNYIHIKADKDGLHNDTKIFGL